MDANRRTLLKGASASSVLVAALAAGILKPTAVFAANWNQGAFDAKDSAGALKAMGATSAADSKDLTLNAPDIAENGAVVHVEIASKIPNTVALSVLVEKNPQPLSANFEFAEGALPEVAVRLKLSQTSNVKAIARTADGKFYTTQKEVKVTVGGCGG